MASNAAAKSPVVPQIFIEVNGSRIAPNIMSLLERAEIESTAELPDTFIVQFHDSSVELMNNSSAFALGAKIAFKFPVEDGASENLPVMEGEITAVEAEYGEDNTAVFIVRGYDLTHRLNRGTHVKTYINMTDDDIVKKIASEVGLSADIQMTTQTHEYVFQRAQTHLEFLRERAKLNGAEVLVKGQKLIFRKRENASETVELTWGTDVQQFSPRISLARQVNTVVVRGWDSKQKQEIVGRATSSKSSPKISEGDFGGKVAQSKLNSEALYLEALHPISSQKEAEVLAQSILDEINSNFVTAEGVSFGNPKITAGTKIKFTNLGERFNGEYTVTSARHVYTKDGYQSFFTVEGVQPRSVMDLVTRSATPSSYGRWNSVVVGIVTDNNDPEQMQRVKVRFPWLDENETSDWARIVTLGGGKERGIQWIPEVNDEVLVAFEHGDPHHPYVLGGLWNSQDPAPEPSAVSGGGVQIRTFQTRTGHILRFTDKPGAEKIELIDGKQSVSIILDPVSKKITIESQGNIEVKASGQVNIQGATINLN